MGLGAVFQRKYVRGSRGRESTRGYAAVDAMVALMIFALTVTLGLQALEKSHQAASLADETGRARTLMAHLLDDAPRSFTAAAGAASGFDWTVEMAAIGMDRPIALCRRAVTLTSTADGRQFSATTLETCPSEPAT